MKTKSYRVEREFGLIVGGILSLMSCWWLYRGKFPTVSQITLPIGAVLVLLGLLFPRALVLPNRAWMAFAEVLSWITTRIILAFVFFGIVMPIGVVKRWFGWGPLRRRAPASDPSWRPYSERA